MTQDLTGVMLEKADEIIRSDPEAAELLRWGASEIARRHGIGGELVIARRERDAAIALLRDVRSQSYGCPFCDNGKLRKRLDGREPFHADYCVYARIDAALAEVEK